MGLEWWNEEQKRWALIAAFYAYLDADPDFREDLQRLFDQVGESPAWDTAVADFCARWPLPPEAREDLRRSYREFAYMTDAHPERARAKLRPGARADYLPTPGVTITTNVIPPGHEGDPAIVMTTTVPWIMPPRLQPFTYDPVDQNRGDLNRQIEKWCQELRRYAIQQDERQAQEAGYKPIPSHMRRGHHHEVVRWIYLRVVLGWSWQMIATSVEEKGASATETSRDGSIGVDAIRKEATEWAARAGIPLRAARRPPS